MDFVISDNLKYNALGRCEKPLQIRNKYTGDMVEVPCGKCNACLVNKCNSGSFLCTIEEAYHRFCYFVTLTYSDDNIPVVYPEVYDVELDLLGNPVDDQKVNFYTTTPRVIKEYGDVLYSTRMSLSYIQKYQNKIKVRNGGIPVLFYKDVQLYVKRLRKFFTKISSANIRYYAVGEYGPKTFRPHWHILFYFSDRKIAEDFIQAANKCWKYGRVDCSASRHSSASYVAGYVNNYSCVPTLLQARIFKPRCFHSTHFGFAPLEEDKEKIYQDPFAYIDAKVLSLFSGNVSAQYFNRVRCFFFPRCPRFTDKNVTSHLDYYTLSFRLRSVMANFTMTTSELYRYIHYIFFVNYPVSGVASVVHDIIKGLFDVFSYTPTLIRDEEYFEKFVKRALYMSNHYVNYVCDGIKTNFSLRLQQIKDFYSTLQLRTLGNWYCAIGEYIEHFGDDADLSPFYISSSVDGVSDDEPNTLVPLVEQLKFEYANKLLSNLNLSMLTSSMSVKNIAS